MICHIKLTCLPYILYIYIYIPYQCLFRHPTASPEQQATRHPQGRGLAPAPAARHEQRAAFGGPGDHGR